MHRAAPHDLRVNGSSDAIGVASDPAPLLSWHPWPGQESVEVEVQDGSGGLIWSSGVVRTTAPELRYTGPLVSRSRYSWVARVTSTAGVTSEWSARSWFETAPLTPADWVASWISRPVPPWSRIIRAIDGDELAWVEPGHWIGQEFHSTGDFHAVVLDLVCDDASPVVTAELVQISGSFAPIVLDVPARVFRPRDRLTVNLELPVAAPAGDWLVRLKPASGHVGWWTSGTSPTAGDDDGVSPVPVVGRALRDGAPEAGTRNIGVETSPAPDPVFRRTFEVAVAPVSARLHAVGVGYGEFAINGHRVAPEEILSPAPTDYDRRVLSSTYDVTGLLRPGHNVIEAAAGRGFYAARGASTWSWNLAPWHREPAITAELWWMDGDGSRHRVLTDGSWSTAAGPVVSDVLYTGETRQQLTGADLEWAPARVVAGPRGGVVPRSIPPITRAATFSPRTVTRPGGGRVVYDFGEVLTGWAVCRIHGGVGDTVILRYGERLDEDGAVLCDNFLACGEAQVDRYHFAGTPSSVEWEPQFSYKGFRYIEAELVGGARLDSLSATSVHTAVAEAGTFECSDDLLTWIDRALARTFLNNLHGIPTDTPVYEKNGWTADAHLAMEGALYQHDLRAVLHKWIIDHMDAQDDEGGIPQIVPTPGWGRTPDPAWSASMVLLPWYHYWEYGDRAILDDSADAVLRFVRRMHHIAEGAGWIWPLAGWGDWLPPGYVFPPEGPMPTATLMLGHLTNRAAEILDVVGAGSAAQELREREQVIFDAYHARYFDERTSTYRHPTAGYRQSMNVLPLAFGAVPAERMAAVADGLVRDIEERTMGHLDVGSVATKHLLPVLTAHGRADLAVTVATQKTAPGWGAWWHAGSHTLWESWDPDARSHNHYFLGSVAHWLHTHVGGLTVTQPGWRAFDVQPPADPRLRWGRTRHRTVRGDVAVEWNRSDEGWAVRLEVPHGASARVLHPVDGSVAPVAPGVRQLFLPT